MQQIMTKITILNKSYEKRNEKQKQKTCEGWFL